MMEKCIIVAVADNYAIGKKNQLLWNLPGDMRYFRETTTGSTVIMGWMTFQSIGRALPKRHNIVISEFPWPDAPSTVDVVASLPEAFTLASKDKGRCFVIGGAYTYKQAMETADTLFITHVHDTVLDADAFFPEIDPALWLEVSRTEPKKDETSGIEYAFSIYKRTRTNGGWKEKNSEED